MWDKLSMSQRSELMGIYVKGGMSSLLDIKLHYNSFAEGGGLKLNLLRPNDTMMMLDNTLIKLVAPKKIVEHKQSLEKLPYLIMNHNEPITTRKDFKGNLLSPLTQGLQGIFTGPMNESNINTYSELRSYYGGYNPVNDLLSESKYKPANNSNDKNTYISINDPKIEPFMQDLSNYIDSIDIKTGGDYKTAYKNELIKLYGIERGTDIYEENKNKTANSAPITKISDNKYNIPRYYPFPTTNKNSRSGLGELGNYQVSKGKDKEGNYISYYDIWDTKGLAEPLGAGKPFEVYDRFYLKKKK